MGRKAKKKTTTPPMPSPGLPSLQTGLGGDMKAATAIELVDRTTTPPDTPEPSDEITTNTTPDDKAMALCMTLRSKLMRLRPQLSQAERARLDKYADLCSPSAARRNVILPQQPRPYIVEPHKWRIMENIVGHLVADCHAYVTGGCTVLPDSFTVNFYMLVAVMHVGWNTVRIKAEGPGHVLDLAPEGSA